MPSKAAGAYRILHTSDWHLGRQLYSRSRTREFEAFLAWLLDTLNREAVDALIVSGDIFHTRVPDYETQKLYYSFLARTLGTCCREVVITCGNHDSPKFLQGHSSLADALNIHIIAGIEDEHPERELLVLKDADNQPRLRVAAVPYLSPAQVRQLPPDADSETLNRSYVQGIARHYQAIAEAARQAAQDDGLALPLMATGHLFTQGGLCHLGKDGTPDHEDDVLDLCVGSLQQVDPEIFAPEFKYVALGHLHAPQKVGGLEHIRYSGAPLAMCFDEASYEKSVCLVDFLPDNAAPAMVQTLAVPRTQELLSIEGDGDALEKRLQELKERGGSCWVEVNYNGKSVLGSLGSRLRELVAGSAVEILKINNLTRLAGASGHAGQSSGEELTDLTPREVFRRFLETQQIEAQEQNVFSACFEEVLQDITLHEGGSDPEGASASQDTAPAAPEPAAQPTPANARTGTDTDTDA